MLTPLNDDAGWPRGVRVSFAAGTDLAAARDVMQKVGHRPDLLASATGAASPYIDAALTAAQITERQRNAIQQNMNSLRNRVNELGVSEPDSAAAGRRPHLRGSCPAC